MSHNTNWCFSRTAILSILLSLLAGCGVDDSPKHVVTGVDSKLSIYGPETQSIADPPYYENWIDREGRWYLEGDGFLPPGTTCYSQTCEMEPNTGASESAYIGEHKIIWENEATGESGIISEGSGLLESSLYWKCYCMAAPRWTARVPVVLGLNRIVVTQRAGNIVQQDVVLVTRE
jgi:hypothetical protein